MKWIVNRNCIEKWSKWVTFILRYLDLKILFKQRMPQTSAAVLVKGHWKSFPTHLNFLILSDEKAVQGSSQSCRFFVIRVVRSEVMAGAAKAAQRAERERGGGWAHNFQMPLSIFTWIGYNFGASNASKWLKKFPHMNHRYFQMPLQTNATTNATTTTTTPPPH